MWKTGVTPEQERDLRQLEKPLPLQFEPLKLNKPLTLQTSLAAPLRGH